MIFDRDNILKEKGIFLLFGEIDNVVSEETVRFIFESNLTASPNYKFITLIINSSGGNLSDGFAIVDAIKGSKIPVHTVGIGQIASCGLLIFISGEKGYRTITKNTSIMSHQWSWGSEGKEHELVSIFKEYSLTNDRVLSHYKSCTGLGEKEIKEKLLPKSDVWLDAKEAKKLGICDIIKDFSI